LLNSLPLKKYNYVIVKVMKKNSYHQFLIKKITVTLHIRITF